VAEQALGGPEDDDRDVRSSRAETPLYDEEER
jgi:hypothetical protein